MVTAVRPAKNIAGMKASVIVTIRPMPPIGSSTPSQVSP
jgi:hypothetical protein